MSAVRYSIAVAGKLIEQLEDGSWHLTNGPDVWGYDSVEVMEKELGFKPDRMTLEEAGFALTGTSIEEIVVGLVTQRQDYLATLKNIGGYPMGPIVNQPWCADADLHQPHVQCRECRY